MDYHGASTRLGERESRKIANNTYLQRRPGGSIAVMLHRTDVLTFRPDGGVVYNTGGWYTMTTKARMNGWGPAQIYSHRGQWRVALDGPAWEGWSERPRVQKMLCTGVPYRDGMVWRDGHIS